MKKLLFCAALALIPIAAFTNTHKPITQGKPMKEYHLVLYYRPSCPFCQKVLNAFPNLSQVATLKNVSTDEDALIKLKQVGGKTQVPCLFIDGSPLYESDLIIQWLQENIYNK